MHFTFVSTGEYPERHASAIRHTLLAKGLVEAGHTVTFLLLASQAKYWDGKRSIKHLGIEYKEIYHYTGNNKLLIHFHYYRAIKETVKIIRQQKKENKIDALVILSLWSSQTYHMYHLAKKTREMGVTVFHDKTELPYSVENKAMAKLFTSKFLPELSGVFVITDKLKTFVQRYNPEAQKLVTVVDLPFFSTDQPSPYAFPYIGYCGTINGNKDGVPILVEAFARIANKFPQLNLVLVGRINSKESIKETTDAIEKHGLDKRVIFTGMVDREMMPVILGNAEILVVSKPDNEQNSGNFPIKIGEYLATGVPVVVTKVGEIPLYIKDGESGFLAEPSNAAAFAEKMEEALNNPNAKQIGLNGKKVAEDNFDYKMQAKIMADYITKINSR